MSQTDGAARAVPAWRVGAIEIERIVCGTIADALTDEARSRIASGNLASDDIMRLRSSVTDATTLLAGPAASDVRALLLSVVRRIVVDGDTLTIECVFGSIDASLGDQPIELTVALPLGCVRTRKRERMLIAGDGEREADPATIRLLARAFAARRTLLDAPSIDAAAASLGYSRDYVVALARLSYLAPDIVTAILDGRIDGSTRDGPLVRAKLPLDWREQRTMLAPG